MNAVSLLLAAGHGRRAGGPKAWREASGRPLLARQLDFLISLFPPEKIFVSIQEEWREKCRTLHAGVNWVAADPDGPAFASLKALAAAAGTGRPAFVHHVDMAVWEREVFLALHDALENKENSRSEAAMPVHGGKGGHPVLLRGSLLGEILKQDPSSARLDHFLRSRRVLRVETPSACVLENANEP